MFQEVTTAGIFYGLHDDGMLHLLTALVSQIQWVE